MKHTQGPWRVREGSLYKEGSTEVNPNLPQRVCEHCKKPATYADGSPLFDPAHISIEAKGWGVAQIGTLNPVKEFEQHMANARLIAAAPAMLEQLRQDLYELTTLSPRLNPTFRKSVEAVCGNIKKIFNDVGEAP